MNIKIETVKKLRAKTGATMENTCKALKEAYWDVNEAEKYLNRGGLNYRQVCEKLETEKKDLEFQLSGFKAQYNTDEKIINDLRAENKKLKEGQELLKGDLDRRDSENDSLRANCLGLQGELDELGKGLEDSVRAPIKLRKEDIFFFQDLKPLEWGNSISAWWDKVIEHLKKHDATFKTETTTIPVPIELSDIDEEELHGLLEEWREYNTPVWPKMMEHFTKETPKESN